MDKRSSLRINNRRETTFGIFSVILAILSGVLFVFSVYKAAFGKTDQVILIGFMELVAMLFCLSGFVFGVIGETRVDRFRKTAHAGILLNGLLGVLHIIVLLNAY